MRKPTLSVIMGNYNDGCYITEALEAILSQSWPPAEVIVIDDGSTDRSVEVIEELARKHDVIKFHRNDENRGVIFSYARALEIASGDYVYIACANDKVLPGFFEKTMNLLSRYPQAGLCHTELRAFDGREYRSYLSGQPRYFAPEELTAKLKRHGYFYAGGMNSVIRRDALLQSGGFIPQTGPLCDLFATMAVGTRHGLCYIPEPLVAIRIMKDSYSGAVKRRGAPMRRLLKDILILLDTPAYRDLSQWIERTGVWPTLFPSMLYVLLKSRARWRYLSPGLVQRAVWVGMRDTVGRIVPLVGKKCYFRMANRVRRLAIAFD
jgi:glycosyltransferase involved in cell wall biosynthesis